ncbi:DUF3152 domain-containing protein [Streptomyces sp. NPDC012888]|uniref:DUF3152 domain-containing protein n=1 Tax=Streptomyces sp. NPDC012888 TaxID=3364855 RepID=UPI0036CC2753
MGRHSRKAPDPVSGAAPAPPPSVTTGIPSAGSGRRRRTEPAVVHQAPGRQTDAAARAGHPQLHEPGGGWGAAGAGTVYGDWLGTPRARTTPAAVLDTDTPAFGTPAVGFPRLTVPGPVPAAAPEREDAYAATAPERAPEPRAVAPESGRGAKVRTYTGMAAAAVTVVLAVVVAGQVVTEDEGRRTGARASGDDAANRGAAGRSAASRSDGRPTPAAPSAAPPQPVVAPEKTYEQKMAEQLPIDPALAGPGTFETVPGLAKAPGKGRLTRYRVDIEHGLGLDGQLFAEAVHRTLNDDRSWAHNGARAFERVPSGEVDFVITLASPGTTGTWCAKSGLDTTIDNVSCDSASTDRVMINAFRWAQGSPTYGPHAMFEYRQMLINHEVGHRLGNGHVSCRTPGAPAPIMQQQTKSLIIDGIPCKPNPWVYPGG